MNHTGQAPDVVPNIAAPQEGAGSMSGPDTKHGDPAAAAPESPSATLSPVLAAVAAERQRQIEKEGWTAEHDAGHVDGALAVAGACYALDAAKQITEEHHTWSERYEAVAKEIWPWDSEWWKPKDARRDLVRAAALIVAELERMDRAESYVKESR